MRYKHTLLEAIEDRLSVKDYRELLYLAERKDQERYERILQEKKLKKGGKDGNIQETSYLRG